MYFRLISGRTIAQGNTVEYKWSAAYQEETARCFLHPYDMVEIGITAGDRVRASSAWGSAVFTAEEWDDVSRGTMFVPYGPWANHLVGTQTHGTGMPDFKSIPVELTPTTEKVATLEELMTALGGVPVDH